MKAAWAGLITIMLLSSAYAEDRRHWDAGDWADYHREQVREGRRAEKPQKRVRYQESTETHRRPSYRQPGPFPIILPFDFFLGSQNLTYAVDDYLCSVYFRMPFKVDSAGDFTWKDYRAADRLHMSVCQYAIKGMHPDLRESLYAFGQVADSLGINWSFLSAFRDDYRQSIASGFKAGPCGSMHGGSCRTKGYGDGRAADLWAPNPSSLFQLIDRIGHRYGLSRPMPGNDPAHVQVGGNWQIAARELRRQRYAAMGIELPPEPKIMVAEIKRVVRHKEKRHRVRIARRRDDDD